MNRTLGGPVRYHPGVSRRLDHGGFREASTTHRKSTRTRSRFVAVAATALAAGFLATPSSQAWDDDPHVVVKGGRRLPAAVLPGQRRAVLPRQRRDLIQRLRQGLLQGGLLQHLRHARQRQRGYASWSAPTCSNPPRSTTGTAPSRSRGRASATPRRSTSVADDPDHPDPVKGVGCGCSQPHPTSFFVRQPTSSPPATSGL